MSAQQSLYIVIVGCGRPGSYIANKLSLYGHSLVVIDINASSFDALSIGVTAASSPPLVLWTESCGMIPGRLEFFVIFIGLIEMFRDMSAMFPRKR